MRQRISVSLSSDITHLENCQCHKLQKSPELKYWFDLENRKCNLQSIMGVHIAHYVMTFCSDIVTQEIK